MEVILFATALRLDFDNDVRLVVGGDVVVVNGSIRKL